jgi:hypothetical protein
LAGWLAGFARMEKNRFHLLAVKTRGFFSRAEMQFASHLSGMSEEEGSSATRLDGWMKILMELKCLNGVRIT